MFDMSYFGKFYLVGVDARKASDWLFSADVSRPPGMRPRVGHGPLVLQHQAELLGHRSRYSDEVVC